MRADRARAAHPRWPAAAAWRHTRTERPPRGVSAAARFPAVFMRGGTSRALFFHRDGPARDRASAGPRSSWPRSAAPTRTAGSSTASAAASRRSQGRRDRRRPAPDADVDYTFAQVDVDDAAVDYRGNCGNISSAVGPFAIDEGLVRAREPRPPWCASTTPTRRRSSSPTCPCRPARRRSRGTSSSPASPGAGARIALDFLDPGGAVHGPAAARPAAARGRSTGIAASLVDATNPMVFVRAADLGLDRHRAPEELDADAALRARLERIRAAAAVRDGHRAHARRAAQRGRAEDRHGGAAGGVSNAGRRPWTSDAVDLVAASSRWASVHRAFALTGAMCLAVAAHLARHARRRGAGASPRGGRRPYRPPVRRPPDRRRDHAGTRGAPVAQTVTVYRTARRLMEGAVLVP